MNKHTPGPWKMMDVRDERNWPKCFSVWAGRGKEHLDDDGTYRAICRTPDGTTKENEANCHLIAAAPDMLEALAAAKKIIESDKTRYTVDSLENASGVLSKINKAIFKGGGTC
jgi:hypothetical protein